MNFKYIVVRYFVFLLLYLRICFGNDFWTILEPFLEPNLVRNWFQMRFETDVNFDMVSDSIFFVFLRGRLVFQDEQVTETGCWGVVGDG